MTYTKILYETKQRSSVITLNCPANRNALDDILIQELTDAVNHAGRDQNSRVIVLQGAGETFCAGMDLQYLKRISESEHSANVEDAKALLNLLKTISSVRKPIIAQVNGPALGGGCGIAAACDFVFVAKNKGKLGVPEVKIGFVPAVILFFLTKRMGEGRTREFVLQGKVFDASEAKEAGLATEVVEDEKLTETVFLFAEKLAASTSPTSIALTKELFSRFMEMNAHEVLEYSANLNALSRKTEDFKKGINSFLNKEKLLW